MVFLGVFIESVVFLAVFIESVVYLAVLIESAVSLGVFIESAVSFSVFIEKICGGRRGLLRGGVHAPPGSEGLAPPRPRRGECPWCLLAFSSCWWCFCKHSMVSVVFAVKKSSGSGVSSA